MVVVSLVTGGAGFIGFHLCKKLLSLGHNIICIDNYISGSEKNIETLVKMYDIRIKFYNIDIIDDDCFKHLLSQHVSIDYIWHLACPASPNIYQKDGIHTLKTCTIGTFNILKLIEYHKCKLLFTSTSEIYGDPIVSPQPESYYGNVNTCGLRSCYDEGKRCAESILYQYRTQHNIENQIKIVRIFNTYGPNMNINDGRVITNLFKSYLLNIPFTINGTGEQTRSMCYIDDLIDGLLLVMFNNVQNPINIGNPDEMYTINYIVKIFNKVTNTKLDIVYSDIDKDDPKHRCPDISLISKYLNWTPKISLCDGLTKMYENIKELN